MHMHMPILPRVPPLPHAPNLTEVSKNSRKLSGRDSSRQTKGEQL